MLWMVLSLFHIGANAPDTTYTQGPEPLILQGILYQDQKNWTLWTNQGPLTPQDQKAHRIVKVSTHTVCVQQKEKKTPVCIGLAESFPEPEIYTRG